MSDASYIELPTRKIRRPFWRSWKGIFLIILCLACICAAWISWWLADGKVMSIYARVDSVVYTVEPETRAIVERVLVNTGDRVNLGQPLATIELPPNQPPAAAQKPTNITGRLDTTHDMESRLAQRAAQARAEEERYHQIHQERVTEYVRAQLALRAVDPGNSMRWEAVSQAEQQARIRRDMALEDFERASKARAAVDTELNIIRAELARQRLRGQPEKQPEEKKAAPPPQPQKATLYAPMAGRIMSVNARQGYAIEPGQPVFLIMPQENGKDAQSWIQAWFPLSARELLKIGQKAQIRNGEEIIPGHITDISSDSQPLPTEGPASTSTRKYLPVRIQLDNPANITKLTKGSRIECQIQARYILSEDLI